MTRLPAVSLSVFDPAAGAYRTLSAKVWLVQGNDGTSRAVLEAMACGVPVVAGSGGAQAELVRSGQDGFVVPLDPSWKQGMPDGEGETAALAEALVKLGDEKLRREMGRSARQRALEFAPEVRAGRLEEIYRTALSRAGRRF